MQVQVDRSEYNGIRYLHYDGAYRSSNKSAMVYRAINFHKMVGSKMNDRSRWRVTLFHWDDIISYEGSFRFVCAIAYLFCNRK